MKQDNMPQVAGFWNSIAAEFDAIYSGKKTWTGRVLDRWLRKDMYGRFAWVMGRSGDISGCSICDVGCGSGRFVNEFANRGATRIVGVDVAPEMLKLARQLVSKSGNAGVCEFVESDVLDWKTKEQFDLTIAIGFWDYIAEPANRLALIRSMTARKFLSAWPRFWTWRMPIRKIRLAAQGCPVYFYTRDQVLRLLHDAHFQVERCDVVGKLYCVEATPR